MITVGTFEAKTKLSALLEKVTEGEEVLITKHGKPLARIVDARVADKSRAALAVERLLEMRKGRTLGGISWKELRDAGRR